MRFPSNRLKSFTTLVVCAFLVIGFIALKARSETKAPVITGTMTALNDFSAHSQHEAEVRLRAEEAQRLVVEQQRAAEAAQKARSAHLAAASRAKRYSGPVGNDIWSALSRCEAGGRPNAVSRSGKYFGAFQFSIGTWHGIGMSGNPIDYPYEVQLEAAKRLQARSGWSQWPVCSRKLGLR